MHNERNFQPQPSLKILSAGQSFWLLFALSIFLAAANLFAVEFIKREHYIYFWDRSGYWERVVSITDHFPKDPYGTIRDLYYSVTIRGDDYNLFPAFLLMPVTLFFRSGRLAYILSIVNVFAFAAAASFALLHLRLSKLSAQSSPILPLISVGVVLLSPNFWNPILYGYLDVGGVVIVNLVLLFYYTKYSSAQNTRDSVIIALLIPIMILFRRWYAFWAVSFYIASFVEQCFFLSQERPFLLKNVGTIVLRVTGQISVSALFLVAVAPTFMVRSLTTNYADIYSPFRFSNSLFESLCEIINRFGIFAFSLFIAGAVQTICDKTTRRCAFLLCLQWLIIFCWFSRTQDFGPHQLYLLLPAMLVLSALFVTGLVMKHRFFVLAAVVALLIMNFLSAFSSQELWYRKPLARIFTDVRHPPLVRSDIDEIDRMLDVLSKTLTDPGDRVYVLASSTIINSSIIRNAGLSLNRHAEILNRVLVTNDWDKRDGFPQQLLSAKYLLVGDPIQYHARPGDQRVVGIPAELVLATRNIGTSFVKLPYQFNLDEGVKCYLYKKVKEFDHTDLSALSQMFKNYYPDRPNIYQINDN
jgi:hypothetical protein